MMEHDASHHRAPHRTERLRSVPQNLFVSGVIRGTMQLPYPSESWRKKLENPPPDFYSLVACADGEVVGNLGLQITSRPRRRHVGSLGMAVRDDWQGKGVGSALMRAALELADGWLELTRLELTVYTDNLPALKLMKSSASSVRARTGSTRFGTGRPWTLTRWRGCIYYELA